jgi:hypothetical protein
VLSKFPDIDRALSGLTSVCKSVSSGCDVVILQAANVLVRLQKTVHSARVGIDTLLFLKQILKTVPHLGSCVTKLTEALNDGDGSASNGEASQLLEAMHQVCNDPRLGQIHDTIENTLIDSSSVSRLVFVFNTSIFQLLNTYLLVVVRSAHEMRHQECFALKAGVDEMLDLHRKTFLLCIHDLYEVAILTFMRALFYLVFCRKPMSTRMSTIVPCGSCILRTEDTIFRYLL